MRKIIVIEFISLDGVMQAPGGPDEDISNDFSYGGWIVRYFDEFMGRVIMKQMSQPFDLLLGRKTYELFASYWPHAAPSDRPFAPALNNARKYVASKTMEKPKWKNSQVIRGDIVEEIGHLKKEDGAPLQVHGSGALVQTLMKHDLIDEFWLKICPITLGPGKRLFAEGAIPAAFRLTECEVSPLGVIVVSYARSGEIKTGSMATRPKWP
jgi:dihydrofolate reductase